MALAQSFGINMKHESVLRYLFFAFLLYSLLHIAINIFDHQHALIV
jgi:hypothetical protein